MEYPKFSFRIALEIGTKLEEEASNRELTTSELVREIVTMHYETSAARRASSGESMSAETAGDAERRFQQLVFEIGKTRSAVLRLQTIPKEVMEQILAAASDAKGYAERVAARIKGLTAQLGSRAMRAVAEIAVRWRAGVTSFHMALQMAARTLLAGVAIWALSTLLLVWFWVYHYLPLGPRYSGSGCSRGSSAR
jgi:hypothetical protein